VQFDVQVLRSNHIKANCGTPGNYQGIKIAAHVRPDADFPRASKVVRKLEIFSFICVLSVNFLHFHLFHCCSFAFVLQGAYEISFPETARGSIQAIGDGCRSFLNYCNGNGIICSIGIMFDFALLS
jgi:hypothetical protein